MNEKEIQADKRLFIAGLDGAVVCLGEKQK